MVLDGFVTDINVSVHIPLEIDWRSNYMRQLFVHSAENRNALPEGDDEISMAKEISILDIKDFDLFFQRVRWVRQIYW